jgi:hypothetical protein
MMVFRQSETDFHCLTLPDTTIPNFLSQSLSSLEYHVNS